MKILINTPSLVLLGGVANHYLGLKKYWTYNVRYNTVGRRSKRISGLFLIPYDIVKFIFRLLFFSPDIVLLNPSLGKSALKRDFIFLKIAKAMNFKVVVFIHGFNWDYAKKVNKHWVTDNLNRASLIFVLAHAFEEELVAWGVDVPILLGTTKVDDALLENYDQNVRDGHVKNILFLSRIEKEKGIFITIETYRILKKKYPFLRLTIAGEGGALPEVRKKIADNDIADVNITGRLSGRALVDAFINADLFLFPSYGEGMPAAVLEAMAFGQPIFTRNVGGLPDFFENGKMGFITDSLDPVDFANAMEKYIEDTQLTKRVSDYNAQYACSHFMASKVAKDMEKKIRIIAE